MSVVRPDALGRQGEVSFVRPVEQLVDLCPGLRAPDVTPYRGLEVFDEEHAGDYFGRDQAINELLDKLSARRFVAVVGVSGSGKSSLVRAGLKKGLERFAIPGLVARSRCLVMPGSAPILDLVLAIAALPGASRAQVGPARRPPLTRRTASTMGRRRQSRSGLPEPIARRRFPRPLALGL